MEKKNYAARVAIYAMGLVILAAGITMNIKTGLGVSTIISVSFQAKCKKVRYYRYFPLGRVTLN